MTKYNNRYEYQISTVNSSKNREDSWLTELDNQLHKQAVQPKRVDQSMFEQINGIINGSKSKYRSVDDAVKEMQSRSGFLDYIKRADSEKKQKHDKPRLLQEYPNIEITINNYCEHTKGEQTLPAVLEYLRSVHSDDVRDATLWDEDSFAKYVHKVNQNNKSNHSKEYQNLGKVHYDDNSADPANFDAFHGLMPAKTR